MGGVQASMINYWLTVFGATYPTLVGIVTLGTDVPKKSNPPPNMLSKPLPPELMTPPTGGAVMTPPPMGPPN